MNDMTPKNRPASQVRLPSSKNIARHLVQGVTADNYREVGSAFIAAYGGAVISLKAGKEQGVAYDAVPRQWGAWRAYFKARKIGTAFMDIRAKSEKCWTVPALWPHEFDGDAHVQDDHEAGDRFIRQMARVEQDRGWMLDQAGRKAQVERLLKPKRSEAAQ